MEEEKDKDLEKETETLEDQSTSEETTQDDESNVSEDVQNSGEEQSQEKEIDDMLSDGTSKKKKVSIEYEKFKDTNEKAKLYENFAPLLAKLNQNPDVVDKLLENKEGETMEQRLERLEKETIDRKRNEMRSVISEAINTWGDDFKSNWDSMKPVVNALEKQGIPYAEAVQRAYFSVNPYAATQNEQLESVTQAVQIQNKQGTFSSSKGTVPTNTGSKFSLSDADKDFASKVGIDPKLYDKHKDFIKQFEDL